MSEKIPGISNSELEERLRKGREQMAAIQELVQKDATDPERGPIVRRVRFIVNEASKRVMEENSPYTEFAAFQQKFLKHFGSEEARRYRLFHIIIGSTPPITSDLFDAEGEWSIRDAMERLGEKYHLGEIDAEAA